MNVNIDEIFAEIGRLHVQVTEQQKVIADLQAKLANVQTAPQIEKGN